MAESNRPLKVFLCHSSYDKATVRELYRQLVNEDWLDVWLDEVKLLPGQTWEIEIEKAVEETDAVIICLSTHSVSKEGYLQKELRFILNIAEEKTEDTIFIIPLRLDGCEVPRRLRQLQWVDYFPAEQQEAAYQRLLESLKARARRLGLSGNQAFTEITARTIEKTSASPRWSPEAQPPDIFAEQTLNLGELADQAILSEEDEEGKSAQGRIDIALWNLPTLPPYHVEDKELIESWKAAICGEEGNAVRVFGIHGIAGVGKTTLAIALAANPEIQMYHQNNVLWASLGPDVKSPDDVRPLLFAWGAVLNLKLPTELPTQALLAIFAKNISKKKMLIVLDDVWSYLPAKQIIDSCGRKTSVLLTSRDEDILLSLNAHIRLLHVLSPDKAIELLQSYMGREVSPPDRPVVTELLSRVGHLPLAISLLGAQVRKGENWKVLLKVFQTAQPSLELIDYSRPESREQSLRISFDLTYSKLSAIDQRRYRLLGVLASSQPFLLDDAAALWAGYEAKDDLERFAEYWLSNHEVAGRILRDFCSLSILQHVGEPQSDVFQQHPLLRFDALRRLSEEELSLALETHARWVLTVTSQYLDQQYYLVFERIGPQIYALLRRLKRSYTFEAGLHVFSHMDARWLMHRMVLMLTDVWLQQRKLIDLKEWVTEAIQCCQQVRDRNGEGLHLGNLGACFLLGKEFHEAEEVLLKSNEIVREVQNQRAEIVNLLMLSSIYEQTGRNEIGIQVTKQAYEMARNKEDKEKEAESLGALGIAYQNLDRSEEAKEYFIQALELARHQEKKALLRNILMYLGKVHVIRHEPEVALPYLQEALELNQTFVDYHIQADILNLLGDTYILLKRIKEAEGYYNQAQNGAQILQNLEALSNSFNGLARAALSRKNRKQAIAHINKALELDRQLGDTKGEIADLKILFGIYAELNRRKDAHDVLDRIYAKANESHLEKELLWYYRISPLFLADHERDRAIETANEGLKHAIANEKDEKTIEMLVTLGRIGKSLPSRILYLFRALIRAERIRDERAKLEIDLDLAEIYKSFDLFIALNHLAQAKALATKLHDQVSLDEIIRIKKEILKEGGEPESLIEFMDRPISLEDDEVFKTMSPFRAAALVVEACNGDPSFVDDAQQSIITLSSPMIVISQNPDVTNQIPILLKKVLDGYPEEEILQEAHENYSGLIRAIFDQTS